MKNIFLVIISSILFYNCGVPQDDYNRLKSKYDSLSTVNNSNLFELEECMNGEERTIAMVEKSYKEKDYKSTKENISNLKTKHPQSSKNKEYELLSKKIEKLETEEINKKEAESKEIKRLANLNNTGIWYVGNYVDDFGDSTGKGFISTSLTGKFSNSATQNSDLNIRFLISNARDFNIKLFEYAGDNPVKAYSTTKYVVRVRDKDGKKYTLYAENYSDRLHFGPSNSGTLHQIFKKGGKVNFAISERDNKITEYDFTITNSDYYDNAYRKLTQKK